MERHLKLDFHEQSRRVHARPRLAREWNAALRAVAVVLWKTALERNVLVDHVVMADTMQYATSDGFSRLLAGPQPLEVRERFTEEPRHTRLGVVKTIEHVLDDVPAQLDAVLREHAYADNDTPHSTLPPRTVGYRVRELRATPGWATGDWKGSLDLLREDQAKAWDWLQSGRWRVSPEELSAARIVSGVKPAAYDFPPLPRGEHPSWLQRAYHLLSVGTAISEVERTVPRGPDGYLRPLSQVLGGAIGVCAELRVSADEVERLWAREPGQVADPEYWDLLHVPTFSVRAEHQDEGSGGRAGHLAQRSCTGSWIVRRTPRPGAQFRHQARHRPPRCPPQVRAGHGAWCVDGGANSRADAWLPPACTSARYEAPSTRHSSNSPVA